jgi:hypothetical protein
MNFLNLLRNNAAWPENRVIAVWSLATAVYCVTFLWQLGPTQLGLGAAVYLASVLGLFLWTMRRRGHSLAASAYWIIPALLIIASYVLYANPFIKAINYLVLPVALAVFYGLGHLPAGSDFRWGARFFGASVARFFSPLAKLDAAGRTFVQLREATPSNRSTAKSIVVGSVVMLAVLVVVVLPLLSAADPAFAKLVDDFLIKFRDLMEPMTVVKILAAALLSIATVAALLAWGRAPSVPSDEAEKKPVDSIVAGIVLGGILASYLLFIALQAKKLVVGQLPFEFSDAVYMVKSGFWQLIILSALNIGLFAVAYRRTVPAVQSLLAAFTVASLLLLASAAHRMGLYVTYYGFSYEKFYACLAVLFCAAMFGYLTLRLFRRERADVMRFAAVLFIWMYAVAAVFPVEQFVWRANVALTKLPGSHIRLYELSMLSSDVLGAVQDRLADGTLLANERATNKNIGQLSDMEVTYNWETWLTRRQNEVLTKKWHQMTVSDVFTITDIARK